MDVIASSCLRECVDDVGGRPRLRVTTTEINERFALEGSDLTHAAQQGTEVLKRKPFEALRHQTSISSEPRQSTVEG